MSLAKVRGTNEFSNDGRRRPGPATQSTGTAARTVPGMSFFGAGAGISCPGVRREEICGFLDQVTDCKWRIRPGFVPNMRVPGTFYVNAACCRSSSSPRQLELQFAKSNARQGFLPALKQIANVAGLPGIVGSSIGPRGLPDLHSGYGFAIGNVAAFGMADPHAVVSPGGVGFDINCGVRLLRTNLTEADIEPVKEQLAQGLFNHIPG